MTMVALAVLVACGGSGGGSEDDAGPEPADAGPQSATAKVKFKRNDRIANDFARTLGIGVGKVCSELGLYSCTHEAHKVALGGSDPYGQGMNEPLPTTTLTTPSAIERVALSACGLRVDRDLEGDGEPLIYGGLDVASDGRLVDVDAQSVADAVDTIYKRAIQRPPTAAEIAHHRKLYEDIEARGPQRPAREWAVLSCFAVMTSMEQLFY
jgi:hypothetical protein